MVAKVLDLKNLSWQRRPFTLSNDGRKVWATILFLRAVKHRKVIQKCQFFRFFFCHIFRTTVCWDPDILLSSWTRDVTTCPLYKGLCQLKQIFFTFEFFRAMLSKVHLFACGMHLSISLIYIRWPCLHTPSPWPRIPLPPVYSRRFKAKPSLKVSVVHKMKVTFLVVLRTKSGELNGILTFG